jgi:hypothetical protein
MGRLDDLLLLEDAGELPAELQKDLDTLRAAGEAPPRAIKDSSGATIGQGQAQPTGGPVKMDVYSTPQTRASNFVSDLTGNLDAATATGIAIKSALPMAGSLVGLHIAGIPGEAIGGALGEMGNQALGVTEPSIAAIGMAMAAGPVVRTGMGIAKTVVGAALKAGGGRAAISEIAEGLTAKLFNPVVSSDDVLAEIAKKGNISIPATSTAQSITDILKAEARRPMDAIRQSIEDALGPLKNFYQPMKGVSVTQDASEVAVQAKRLRLLSKEAYKAGNTDLGHALSNVRNGMFDDAERVGVPELRQYVKTFRKEAAVEELQGIMRQATPLKAFKDLQKKNALFKDSFDPHEQEQIKNILKKLSTVSPSGFSGVAGRGIAVLGGQQMGGVGGAIAGFIAPEMAAGMIATKMGRSFMEKLLVGGTWDAPRAAAMGQLWRSQMAEDATSGNIAERVQAMLKDSNTSVDEKISAAAMRTGIIEAAKTEEGQSWGLGIEIDKFLNKLQPEKDK